MHALLAVNEKMQLSGRFPGMQTNFGINNIYETYQKLCFFLFYIREIKLMKGLSLTYAKTLLHSINTNPV